MFRWLRCRAFRCRWTTRTLLALLTCCAVAFGYLAKKKHDIAHRHSAIAEIRAAQGSVRTGFPTGMLASDWSSSEPPTPQWLTTLIGEEAFLRVQGIGVRGANTACLRSLPLFPELEDLTITQAPITDDLVACLETMSRVRRLSLKNTSITDRTVRLLCNKADLESLDLAGTKITDASLKFAADIVSLMVLDVADTPITDEGIRCLARLTGLRHLHLANTLVTDKAIETLESLPKLTYLDVHGTGITEAGLLQLKSSGELHTVVVPDAVTVEAISVLRAAMPGTKFVY